MRARGLLLALLLIASACSSAATPEQADSDSESTPTTADGSVAADDDPVGVIADTGDESTADDGEDSAGRMLGEPSQDPANEETPEGLAFEAAQPDSADDTEAESSNDADSPVPATEFDLLLNELIDFVEDERGYRFAERPSVERLDSAAFSSAWTEVIVNDVAENSADYINYTDIYRAMGIIDGDRNLEEIWQRFGDAGVIGFYDPDTASITLRSGEVNAFTESVLVHELVHALEDQIFDLDRPEYSDRQDELEWTFSALTEGSARRIESAYRATFSAAKQAEETAARQALPRAVSLTEFNPSFLELQFGRYRYGETFAAALWADGKDTLDAAFANPPATSEAILDPSGFLAGADTPTVKAPPADGDVFESGVWGQAGWAAILTDLTDRTGALSIADGWDGDSFVAWRQGTTTCVRTHLAGDSPDDLDEYAAALEEWATLGEGREIFYPTADLIRITACA